MPIGSHIVERLNIADLDSTSAVRACQKLIQLSMFKLGENPNVTATNMYKQLQPSMTIARSLFQAKNEAFGVGLFANLI